MDINNATLDDDMMNGPHFVIAGAMKSGTTWLHKALNSVSGVTIPKDEVHLYDCNDPIVHPEFQKITFRGLALRRAKETVWGDYICETRDLLGYDSTTLFHSKIDYKKLAKDEPSLKIIVILRNPVDRSYSHYWHLVRTGRVKFNFEREILFGRQEILERSFYVANAERLTQSFGSRCLFVCYESLFSEREENLDRIGKFLELSSSQIKELKNFTSNRANEGRYPRFPLLWRFFSRMIPMNQSFRYQKQLKPKYNSLANAQFLLFYLRIFLIAILSGGYSFRKLKMRKLTRTELLNYFMEVNQGIDEITNVEFTRYWER